MTEQDIDEEKQQSTPKSQNELVKSEEEYSSLTALGAENAARSVSIAMMVNPTAIQALAQKAPEKVLDLAESNDRRQFEFYTRIEENRHQQRLAREATTRIGIGAVVGVVGMAFIYAALTRDASLAQIIVAAVVGGFGGLGISVVLAPKKNDD